MNRPTLLIGLGVLADGTAAGGAWWLNGYPAPAASTAASGDGSIVLAQAPGDMPIFADDRILGQAEAPVTIIEFSSLTCPHCARFHKDTLPQVKTDWIETGRARLIYRHYPLDQLALRAAAVANCIQGDGFFSFLDVLFANQQKWAGSPDPAKALQQYAALAGLSPDAFQACFNDEAVMTRILEKQTDGRDAYNVASTPSFVVNGTPVVGAVGYDQFNSVLETAASKAS